MAKFYVTFSPSQVPPLRTWQDYDGVVEVVAPTGVFARHIAVQIFDLNWASLYDEADFAEIDYFFPKGVTATINRHNGIYTIRPR